MPRIETGVECLASGNDAFSSVEKVRLSGCPRRLFLRLRGLRAPKAPSGIQYGATSTSRSRLRLQRLPESSNSAMRATIRPTAIGPASFGTRRKTHYAARYLAEFQYRFNRRYDLAAMLPRLLQAAVTALPLPRPILLSSAA